MLHNGNSNINAKWKFKTSNNKHSIYNHWKGVKKKTASVMPMLLRTFRRSHNRLNINEVNKSNTKAGKRPAEELQKELQGGVVDRKNSSRN